jgi:hypothetical protein
MFLTKWRFTGSIMSLSHVAIGAVTGLVAIVLILGLGNMLRGGSPNLAQKLMRWRVGLQFFAILVILSVLWLKG